MSKINWSENSVEKVAETIFNAENPIGYAKNYRYVGSYAEEGGFKKRRLQMMAKALLVVIAELTEVKAAIAHERKLADELAEALALLVAAKKQKDAFGRDDKDYQQMKCDGWHLASINLAKHQAARGTHG